MRVSGLWCSPAECHNSVVRKISSWGVCSQRSPMKTGSRAQKFIRSQSGLLYILKPLYTVPNVGWLDPKFPHIPNWYLPGIGDPNIVYTLWAPGLLRGVFGGLIFVTRRPPSQRIRKYPLCSSFPQQKALERFQWLLEPSHLPIRTEAKSRRPQVAPKSLDLTQGLLCRSHYVSVG